MARPHDLFDRLLDALQQQFKTAFQPGEALPGERPLAEMHGVAPSTVHRALCQLAAEGLIKSRPGGWFMAGVPAAAPRGLRRVGLISRRSNVECENPEEVQYHGLAAEGARRGIDVQVVTNPLTPRTTPRRNRVNLSLVPWNSFDVAVLVDVFDAETLGDPLLQRRPVLVFDLDARPFGLPSVIFDYAEAGRLAAKHLLELGHRRFAVTDEFGDENWPAEQTWMARRHAFEACVGAYGGTVLPAWRLHAARGRQRVPKENLAVATAAQWAAAPPGQRPTALFMNNLALFQPLREALESHGWKIPRDLSIVTVSWDCPAGKGRPEVRSISGRAAHLLSACTMVYCDLPALIRRTFDAAEALLAGVPPFGQRERPAVSFAPVRLITGFSTTQAP